MSSLYKKNKLITAISIVTAIILVILLFFGSFLRRVVFVSYDSLSSIYASVLAMLANNERQIDRAPVLKESELLSKAAKLKAEDMVSKNYFAHNSPDGKTPWYWFTLVGYDYRYAGENLAVNFTDSDGINRAWMNSPTHRANILNKNFTEVGIGMATGTYMGREAVYVVQMFGTPVTP